MTKKNTKKNNYSPKVYITWFWRLFAFGVVAVIGLFLLASWGVFGEMPDHTILENPETNLATEIISADGKTLAVITVNLSGMTHDIGMQPIEGEQKYEQLLNESYNE